MNRRVRTFCYHLTQGESLYNHRNTGDMRQLDFYLDEVESISDGMGSGGTGGRHRVVRALKTKTNRDVARSQVGKNSRHEIRAELRDFFQN